MRFQKYLLSALFLLILTFGTYAMAEEIGENATINATNVRLRAENNTSSEILATMSKGTQLIVTGEAGDWYEVIYGGMTGYVLNTYITITEELVPIDDVGSEAGYVNASNVRLRADSNTNSKIMATLNRGTTLTVLNYAEEWYEVSVDGMNGYILGIYVTIGEANVMASPSASAAAVNPGAVELLDWSEVKGHLGSGVVASVTDVATGITFQIKVHSSGRHADVEPLTADDTAKILQIRGGSYSWTPRAVWVTVNGRTFAAACNGMPHSVSNIKNNNFPGHFCIHFLNSRNNYDAQVNPSMQKQVEIAYRSGN
ncbi:MAG: SH3 domain-containing protein [Oscillospiraceae bacterium]|nr:SH3 domain-containing protein [Oscillospiraceae bacterium]